MRFHSGEREVQERAGVRHFADEVGEGISDSILPRMDQFLEQSKMAVLGTVDSQSGAWASVAAGDQGFIHVLDRKTITITAHPADSDPVFENLSRQGHAALLAVDFATGRRVRLNGLGLFTHGKIRIEAGEVYGNCLRYVQQRVLLGLRRSLFALEDRVERSPVLSVDQQRLISRADTFFFHSQRSSAAKGDMSHKGGNPGFILASSGRQIVFPDCNGNRMFNTLRNITDNPNAGLPFIDFDGGRTLQITGRAVIDWDARRAQLFPGAERVIDYEVAKVIHHDCGFPLVSSFQTFSRFNP